MTSSIERPRPIFWLHVKKSAGISTRQLLSPVYVQDARRGKPQCFIMAEKHYWNDILNNYRMPLGEYQFKRMQFARKHLYSPEEFESLFKFAFCREPLDRCISQFFYLWHKPDTKHLVKRSLIRLARLEMSKDTSWNFSRFLDAIAAARASESNDKPHGLHFQTHTATMFDDITDPNGTVLLDRIWRLEDLDSAIGEVRQIAGLGVGESAVHLNKSKKSAFAPNPSQVRKVRELFEKDFELYEATPPVA